MLERLRTFPPNTPISGAVSQALEANREDPGDLPHRLSLLFLLPAEVTQEIEATHEVVSREMLLGWRNPVNKALGSILFSSATINQVYQHYGDGDLMALRVCADILHRHRREQSLAEDQLDRISGMINDLLDTLRADGDLDPALREVLLAHAQAMIRAVYDLPLRGTRGLQEAAAQTCGILILRPDLTVRHDSSPKTWQKVVALLSALAAIFGFGTAIIQAIETASPSASHQDVVVVENTPVRALPSGHQESEHPRVTVSPSGQASSG